MRSNFILENHVLTTKASKFTERLKRWSQSGIIWPLVFGSGFSEIEFKNLYGARYNVEKIGFEGIRYSPAQADLLVITGPVTHKSFVILNNIYKNMCEPKWVVALGSEAISGGLFQNYSHKSDWKDHIPVDIQIPGDPPTPESILEGIKLLKTRIESGVVKNSLESE
ncbi:MAG: NADH-quinone oxidoreductase subunit NuoB [Bacteriovoracaceae bacterium]|nr:NADH-quinone oxidoreductase subunit NuoB [Bacteriovoracaceae bacterium]